MSSSYFVSPEFWRFILLAGIIVLHVQWIQLITHNVPNPYLDEVFHIPQAQAFWQGKWTQWDPKITTPPGLYLFSYVISTVRSWFSEDFILSTGELRFTNAIVLYLLLVALYVWTAVNKRDVHHEAVFQREFNIIAFPLVFFFSGMYYTDLFSTFTVILTYTFWSLASRANGTVKVIYQLLHLLFGLVALVSRQTNIFWVAVYLGGLQLVRSVKNRSRIHDPPISEAFLEGKMGRDGCLLILN
jgi:alpha-1,2-glucosyltransferase